MTARLTIVTNHPDRAVLAVLGVETAPAWLAIVTTLEGVRDLAPGSRVIGQWFEPRKHRSALEWAFQTRRLKGDLLGLSLQDCDRLADWAARHGSHAAVESSLAAATGGMAVSERRINPANGGKPARASGIVARPAPGIGRSAAEGDNGRTQQ